MKDKKNSEQVLSKKFLVWKSKWREKTMGSPRTASEAIDSRITFAVFGAIDGDCDLIDGYRTTRDNKQFKICSKKYHNIHCFCVDQLIGFH